MFDDCKGEKLYDLLASFSTLVLRKVLAEEKKGGASIAGRLAIAKTISVRDKPSFLPLAVAHRASLTALLRRKRDLRARYADFANVLKLKEEILGRRFETVLETQEFLNNNIIPDHTSSRLSKQFEKHWQGDPKLLGVIENDEEDALTDHLLDRPFRDIWSHVSDGSLKDGLTSNLHGLLKDLEKRVEEQQVRLHQWQRFRDSMRKDHHCATTSKKHDKSIAWSKTFGQDVQKERDFVFSPRKSPRKSMWGIEESPKQSPPIVTDGPGLDAEYIRQQRDDANHAEEVFRNQDTNSNGKFVRDLGQKWSDESGLSQISNSYQKRSKHPNIAPQLDEKTPSNNGKMKKLVLLKNRKSDPSSYEKVPSGSSTLIDSGGSSFEDNDSAGLFETPSKCPQLRDRSKTEFSDSKELEDDLLAERIVSMAITATPTPAKPKPKPTLAERTRQSMAFAGPGSLQKLAMVDSSPSSAVVSPNAVRKSDPPSITSANNKGTLLERTRQSISLVPTQPRKHHNRRPSKLYPTNQFETPRKHQPPAFNELTPPEELFSPGAGYDSVFKSRPKVGFSPTTSLAPGDGPQLLSEVENGYVDGGREDVV